MNVYTNLSYNVENVELSRSSLLRNEFWLQHWLWWCNVWCVELAGCWVRWPGRCLRLGDPALGCVFWAPAGGNNELQHFPSSILHYQTVPLLNGGVGRLVFLKKGNSHAVTFSLAQTEIESSAGLEHTDTRWVHWSEGGLHGDISRVFPRRTAEPLGLCRGCREDCWLWNSVKAGKKMATRNYCCYSKNMAWLLMGCFNYC